jgi:HD superfamily phosphohydrolase YqeK
MNSHKVSVVTPSAFRESAESARELAAYYGVDVGLVDEAAAHDIARAMSGSKLLNEARRIGKQISDLEERIPILLHGPIRETNLLGRQTGSY